MGLVTNLGTVLDKLVPGWGHVWRYAESTPAEGFDSKKPLLNLIFSPITAGTSVTAFETVVSPFTLG